MTRFGSRMAEKPGTGAMNVRHIEKSQPAESTKRSGIARTITDTSANHTAHNQAFRSTRSQGIHARAAATKISSNDRNDPYALSALRQSKCSTFSIVSALLS